MPPYGTPGDRGFGRVLISPEHFDSGTSSLEWAIFALVLLLVLLSVATLALMLANRFARRGKRRHWAAVAGGPPLDPLAVVSTRYARGEISREEFLQTTDDLRAAPPRAQPEETPPEEPPPEETTVEQPPSE